jgi:hypothetical protein
MGITPGQPIPSQAGQSGKFLTTNGTALSWGTAGGGSPGGSTTQIQYNDAGAFAGAAALTYATTGTHLTATAQAATDVPLKVVAAASQSGDLFAAVNSGGTSFVRVFPTEAAPTALVRVGHNALAAGTGCLDLFRGNNGSGNQVFRVVVADGINARVWMDGEGNAYFHNRISFGSNGGLSGTINIGGSGRAVRNENSGEALKVTGNGLSVIHNGTAATVCPTTVQGFASQSANLQEWQSSASAVYGTVTENGYFTTRKTSAPADAELIAGELAWWFDSSNGAAKAVFKGKSADGTVVTGEVALA